MTTLLVTVSPLDRIRDAATAMDKYNHQIMPVVNEHKVFQGLIASQDIKLAEWRRGEQVYDMSVGAWLHHHVITVDGDTPFHVAEKLLSENTIGMLPVVDDDNFLQGALTRTDILVVRRLWPEPLTVSNRVYTA